MAIIFLIQRVYIGGGLIWLFIMLLTATAVGPRDYPVTWLLLLAYPVSAFICLPLAKKMIHVHGRRATRSAVIIALFPSVIALIALVNYIIVWPL